MQKIHRSLFAIAMLLVLTSCSHDEPLLPTTMTTTVDHTDSQSSPSTTPATTPSPPASAATAPTGPGTAVEQVAAWVEAGAAADPAHYRTGVDHDGQTHQLDQKQVAFTSPSKKIACYLTAGDQKSGDYLYCDVDFQDRLPKPSTAYGNWLPDIVSYDGAMLLVGEGRGDPPIFFFTGYGPELGYGQKLSLGDVACRLDEVGLTCVNKSKGSGVLLNDQGVTLYGCLRESAETGNSAKAYKC